MVKRVRFAWQQVMHPVRAAVRNGMDLQNASSCRLVAASGLSLPAFPHPPPNIVRLLLTSLPLSHNLQYSMRMGRQGPLQSCSTRNFAAALRLEGYVSCFFPVPNRYKCSKHVVKNALCLVGRALMISWFHKPVTYLLDTGHCHHMLSNIFVPIGNRKEAGNISINMCPPTHFLPFLVPPRRLVEEYLGSGALSNEVSSSWAMYPRVMLRKFVAHQSDLVLVAGFLSAIKGHRSKAGQPDQHPIQQPGQILNEFQLPPHCDITALDDITLSLEFKHVFTSARNNGKGELITEEEESGGLAEVNQEMERGVTQKGGGRVRRLVIRVDSPPDQHAPDLARAVRSLLHRCYPASRVKFTFNGTLLDLCKASLPSMQRAWPQERFMRHVDFIGDIERCFWWSDPVPLHLACHVAFPTDGETRRELMVVGCFAGSRHGFRSCVQGIWRWRGTSVPRRWEWSWVRVRTEPTKHARPHCAQRWCHSRRTHRFPAAARAATTARWAEPRWSKPQSTAAWWLWAGSKWVWKGSCEQLPEPGRACAWECQRKQGRGAFDVARSERRRIEWWSCCPDITISCCNGAESAPRQHPVSGRSAAAEQRAGDRAAAAAHAGVQIRRWHVRCQIRHHLRGQIWGGCRPLRAQRILERQCLGDCRRSRSFQRTWRHCWCKARPVGWECVDQQVGSWDSRRLWQGAVKGGLGSWAWTTSSLQCTHQRSKRAEQCGTTGSCTGRRAEGLIWQSCWEGTAHNVVPSSGRYALAPLLTISEVLNVHIVSNEGPVAPVSGLDGLRCLLDCFISRGQLGRRPSVKNGNASTAALTSCVWGRCDNHVPLMYATLAGFHDYCRPGNKWS